MKFELCRVKTRENARSSAVPSVYRNFVSILDIDLATKIRFRTRTRSSLALYSLHFSFLVTESYSIASKVVVPLSVSFIASIRDAFATHCEDVSNFRMLSRTIWPFEMYASVAYRLFPCHFLFWHWAICLYRDLDILIIQFDSFISSITSAIETEGLRLCEIIIRNIECFIINI